MADDTLLDIRNRLKRIINRTDLDADDGLADQFISDGARMVYRTLGLPAMERLVALAVDSEGTVTIPSDYIELRSLYIPEKKPFINKPFNVWHSQKDTVTDPEGPFYYTRLHGRWLVAPTLAEGTQVSCWYVSGQSTDFEEGGTSTSSMMANSPDLFAYAAAVFAAVHYRDDRKESFQDTADAIADAIKAQHDKEKAAEGPQQVEPLYDDVEY